MATGGGDGHIIISKRPTPRPAHPIPGRAHRAGITDRPDRPQRDWRDLPGGFNPARRAGLSTAGSTRRYRRLPAAHLLHRPGDRRPDADPQSRRWRLRRIGLVGDPAAARPLCARLLLRPRRLWLERREPAAAHSRLRDRRVARPAGARSHRRAVRAGRSLARRLHRADVRDALPGQGRWHGPGRLGDRGRVGESRDPCRQQAVRYRRRLMPRDHTDRAVAGYWARRGSSRTQCSLMPRRNYAPASSP
jgi:hypothetical protein